MQSNFDNVDLNNNSTTVRHLFLFMAIVMVSIVPFVSKSQTWSGVGGGVNGYVNAFTIYNGDLIVGGNFTSAGGTSANYIASWNGTSWSALGTGMDNQVKALCVYNGELFAGGYFLNAGGLLVNNIARWNGSSWSDVSGGTNSIVAALTVHNNQLIVGGYFTDCDGLPANYISSWDITNGWAALGAGTGGSQGQVMALEVYGNDLIATGFFTTAGGNSANQIAKWNGNSWFPLTSGTGWATYSLLHYGNDLIVGGLFSTPGGINAPSIAKWDGTSWSALGSGMGPTIVGDRYVFALASYNGNLYAGGEYLTAGGLTCNGMAKWDGNTWSDLQGGVTLGTNNTYGVYALIVYGNDLIAGGLFSTAGGTGVSYIAAWNEPATSVRTTCTKASVRIIPNPAGNCAVILVETKTNSHVVIKIYDLNNRELSTITDNMVSEGSKRFDWKTVDIPDGIYFCKTIIDGEVAGRDKIVVMH